MTLIVTAYQTPVGWLNVAYDEHYIYRAVFDDTPTKNSTDKTGLGRDIHQELNHYFDNPHHRFQLPLKPLGTTYQQRVWNALLVIPVGRTMTYGQLANTLLSSPRAIGQACKNNPLALFIPCHRVVGKDNPGGYMGHANALNYKEYLLNHEGVFN
ncbi:methylated-DNA--[protein]-cysteine S-methyltransferase [Legionella spiritensis]|uniref:Methylated DNA protein cysteine S-methyltransferase n=1 Tax=Legionella spiritensis TaxID=452 RepID=A0A0W0Z066_LEGSP|nr:methylated-DNA--[protein]-cysteine S-methyltransferase [Legionella spiritensis]KTD62529.1 methylated DNA protein cysteine S- methyltransferase [Legionella spiritensis]SNV30797.1 Methylated DNA-protein cysteine methyltransferase [Legionella spiritensis]